MIRRRIFPCRSSRFCRQVYAVEFTDMAKHARRLVAKNGMEGVVDVIQGSVEELELPGKVKGHVLVVFPLSLVGAPRVAASYPAPEDTS